MQRIVFLSSLLFVVYLTNAQRITTIQLDGVQYFVSRMNPYSPELNHFLAYQYCRSLGLQLVSFETREKADSITQYLSNAGYNKYDFWTSGNKLGTDMFLWMSTGLPFNATFNYIKRPSDASDNTSEVADVPTGSTSPQRTARESGSSGDMNSCIALKAPNYEWESQDCMSIKDFICEQTRCYYYNYGSIPVSSAQGRPVYSTTLRPLVSTSAQPPQPHQLASKFVPQAVGINELISKLRSTSATATPAVNGGDPATNAVYLPDVPPPADTDNDRGASSSPSNIVDLAAYMVAGPAERAADEADNTAEAAGTNSPVETVTILSPYRPMAHNQ